jgi:hypothetical protein
VASVSSELIPLVPLELKAPWPACPLSLQDSVPSHLEALVAVVDFFVASSIAFQSGGLTPSRCRVKKS